MVIQVSARMWFEIVTTGRGMMKAGVVVGNIKADTIEHAVDALVKFLGPRRMIWELRPTGEVT